MNTKIRSVLEDEKQGKAWLVAAVVHGSTGYYSPLGAENCINEYVSGQKENYSERCMACFGSDLEKEILHDLSNFESLSPDKQNQVLNIVKQVKKLGPMGQMTFGLLYPSQMT
jgi:hypothetical protein